MHDKKVAAYIHTNTTITKDDLSYNIGYHTVDRDECTDNEYATTFILATKYNRLLSLINAQYIITCLEC